MKRKLLLLNAALVALTALAGWRLHEKRLAAKAREQRVLGQSVRPAPPPPLTPLTPAKPVAAAGYIDIAQKMLFSKDRNPVVVVEPPPPPAPAPPPKPMPALPVVYGVMNLGDGTTAVMSENATARHRGIHPGEQVGEFKLLAVNNQEIVLEWEGKVVTKKLEEVMDRSSQQAVAGSPSASGATPAASAPPPPVVKGQPAPGVSIGSGVRACQPGDTSPPGTVVDGMRKVVTDSPFGQVCRWEAVK